VYVNRLWRNSSASAFQSRSTTGRSQGEWPTHPELLDWLADEFVHSQWRPDGTPPWDVKHNIRAIVDERNLPPVLDGCSGLEERDPDNACWRADPLPWMPRWCAIVALSFLACCRKFGGPSANPHQPDGYLAAMNFPNANTRQAVAKISIGAVSTRFGSDRSCTQPVDLRCPHKRRVHH